MKYFFQPLSWALMSFGGAFFLALTLFFVIQKLPLFQKLRERREGGRTTTEPLFFRLGGVVLLLAFWGGLWANSALVFSPAIKALFVGSLLIFLVGLWDDLSPLPWYAQLLFQISLGVLLIVFGLSIDIMQGLWGGTIDLRTFFPGLPLLALFFWVLLIMNAVNWLDGLDGLLGSVTLIGFLTLFAVSLFPEVKQPALALLSLFLAGGVLAFLVFNWYPARILAGTTGAYFLGFSLAALSVMAGAKVATALLVLALPILDALWVVGERLRSHVSIFLPDNRHLHYRLLELGWSHERIAITYTLFTLLMAFLALNTRTLGKLMVFLLASGLILGTCALASLLTHKKKAL